MKTQCQQCTVDTGSGGTEVKTSIAGHVSVLVLKSQMFKLNRQKNWEKGSEFTELTSDNVIDDPLRCRLICLA